MKYTVTIFDAGDVLVRIVHFTVAAHAAQSRST